MVSAFCQQMSLTDFLKLGRLCLLSNQYIWISIPIKYYFRNSCINLIVDLLLCLFWKQLFNLNSLTNLSKFDHKKIWLIHSSYLRLDCFWIKDALSILTLWGVGMKDVKGKWVDGKRESSVFVRFLRFGDNKFLLNRFF